MNRNSHTFEIIDKSVSPNGPSLGLGVVCMMLGFTGILIGFGLLEIIAIAIGLCLLLLAAYLVLSIDCIGIDKFQNRLYLYKDYYITTTGKEYAISDYESVCIYFQIDRPRNSGRNWSTTQIKTFSVTLISKTGQKLVMKELGEISAAKKMQEVVAGKANLKLIKDLIRE